MEQSGVNKKRKSILREFVPQLNPRKRKICKSLVNFDPKLNFVPEIPPSCFHQFECGHHTTYERTCVLCGLVSNGPHEFRHEEDWKKIKPKFELPRVYSRPGYFRKKLEWWLETKQDTDWENANEMKEKLFQLPCPCTWKEIFDTFKTGNKKENRAYSFILHFLKIKPDFIQEDEDNLFKVDLYFDEFCTKYNWKIKKKMNIYYLLYKIIQMRYGQFQYVPNKLTQTCMDTYDEKWKVICDEFNWEYFPSAVVLWNWGKDEVMQEMGKVTKPREIIEFTAEQQMKRSMDFYNYTLEAVLNAINGHYPNYRLYVSYFPVTKELRMFSKEFQYKGLTFELFCKMKFYFESRKQW